MCPRWSLFELSLARRIRAARSRFRLRQCVLRREEASGSSRRQQRDDAAHHTPPGRLQLVVPPIISLAFDMLPRFASMSTGTPSRQEDQAWWSVADTVCMCVFVDGTACTILPANLKRTHETSWNTADKIHQGCRTVSREESSDHTPKCIRTLWPSIAPLWRCQKVTVPSPCNCRTWDTFFSTRQLDPWTRLSVVLEARGGGKWPRRRHSSASNHQCSIGYWSCPVCSTRLAATQDPTMATDSVGCTFSPSKARHVGVAMCGEGSPWPGGYLPRSSRFVASLHDEERGLHEAWDQAVNAALACNRPSQRGRRPRTSSLPLPALVGKLIDPAVAADHIADESTPLRQSFFFPV